MNVKHFLQTFYLSHHHVHADILTHNHNSDLLPKKQRTHLDPFARQNLSGRYIQHLGTKHTYTRK